MDNDKHLIKRLTGADTAVTDADLDVIKRVASKYGIPIHGIDLIPTKDGLKVYFNLIGLTWFVQTDDRKVREVKTECKIDAYDNDKGRAKYTATVRFLNNAVFSADGSASPASVKGGKCTRDDVNAMAQTRALRKAMLLATASSLIHHDGDVITEWEIENMARVTQEIPNFDHEVVQLETVLDKPHTITGINKGTSRNTGQDWYRAVAVVDGETVEYFLPNSIRKAVQWFFSTNKGETWDVVIGREEGNNGYFKYTINNAPDEYEAPAVEAEFTEVSVPQDDIPF